MPESPADTGVLAPVLTPFRDDLSPEAGRFLAHCRWLLEQGASGLAVFGTTSEANSLSVDEREALFDRLIEAGIPAERLMVGTGCCALTDTVRLTRHALARGCRRALMLPPFYYKAVEDEGVYRAIAEAIERVGDERLRVYLYHIPPVAQVGFGLPVVERLLRDYPRTVAGIKDSSGDWTNTRRLLEAFPGFGVFAGSEAYLLETLRGGGAGCITATGNVNMAAIRALFDAWRSPQAEPMQAEITALRGAVQAHPMIPALKAILAHHRGDPGWRTVRPPLLALDAGSSRRLIDALERRRFRLAA